MFYYFILSLPAGREAGGCTPDAVLFCSGDESGFNRLLSHRAKIASGNQERTAGAMPAGNRRDSIRLGK